MNETIVKRRSEMVKLRSMGLPLQEVVSELNGKYKVTKSWLYHDWQQRERWLPIILDLKDASLAYWDLVACHVEIKRLAFLQYYKADNSNAAVGALNLLRVLNHDFMEMFPQPISSKASFKKGQDMNDLLKKYAIALEALPKVEL